MDAQQYVQVSFYRIPFTKNMEDKILLKKFDLPRQVVERRKWVIIWVQALLQVKFKKDHISIFYSYYYPKNQLELLKAKLQGEKSALSKYNNLIEKHKQFVLQTEMFYEEKDDLDLKKAIAKRDNKIKAINDLENLINSIEKNQ